MRESKIERDNCKFAETLGWRNIKLNGPGDRGKPDRMFFRGPPPQIVFIEYKRTGEKLGPLQVVWRRWLRQMGFEIHTVDNLEDANAIFADKG